MLHVVRNLYAFIVTLDSWLSRWTIPQTVCLNLRILTTVDFHIFTIIIFVFEKIGLKMKDERAL